MKRINFSNFASGQILTLALSLIMLLCFIPGAFSTVNDEPRVIRVAGDINYPPYEFMDENAVYRGFNVDMLGAVFLELELPFELIPMTWDDAQRALLNGEVDMIQGMTKTFERESQYLFAEPLVVNSYAIFVRKDNTIIAQLSDLVNHRVSYQAGDVAEEILSNQPMTESIGFADQEQALTEVLEGRADAFVGNRLTAIYYLQKLRRLDELIIVGEPMYVTNYGMAVRNDEQELLSQLNVAIERVKSAGVYERIYKKWFGEQLTDYGMTLEQVQKIFLILLTFLSAAILVALVIRQWNEKLSQEVERQTERIRAQEAALRQYDKMQAVGNLVAGIAHELRNPLTSIKAFSELVPIKRDNDHFIEEFEKIVPSEITRMDQLISGLLDYARPKPSEPKPVDLFLMFEDLKHLVRNRLETEAVAFQIKLEVPMVFADPYQLKQIFLNLILNSLDAMASESSTGSTSSTAVSGSDPDRIEKRATLRAGTLIGQSEGPSTRPKYIEVHSETKGNRIGVTLTDNGPGMSAEDVSRVFELFFSSKRGGHGLGLSIVEQLVRENEGTIEISSTPGAGTAVLLNLPSVPMEVLDV